MKGKTYRFPLKAKVNFLIIKSVEKFEGVKLARIKAMNKMTIHCLTEHHYLIFMPIFMKVIFM